MQSTILPWQNCVALGQISMQRMAVFASKERNGWQTRATARRLEAVERLMTVKSARETSGRAAENGCFSLRRFSEQSDDSVSRPASADCDDVRSENRRDPECRRVSSRDVVGGAECDAVS
jgi:hypothetical protein